MNDKYFENEVFEDIKLNHDVIVGYEFIDCDFINCSLNDCKLLSCSFSGCRFKNCSVQAVKTENSEIKFGEFYDCDLSGINWALLQPTGRFGECINKISGSRLKYNNFLKMNFKKFDFSGSEFISSMFADCVLTESSFYGCDLRDTEFFRCDLRKADFRKAEGYQVDIMTAKLQGAKFSMPDAMNLLSSLKIKIE